MFFRQRVLSKQNAIQMGERFRNFETSKHRTKMVEWIFDTKS